MARAKLLSLLILLAGAPLPAATVPAGFDDTLVAGVGATALAFTPDSRLLIATQPGALRILQGGTLLATPALTIPAASICTTAEQGLLGVAVDPVFGTTPHIFLFYTFRRPDGTCVNRVSRFTLPAGNVIDPGTELVLIDNMPAPSGSHNAGDVHFGKDGHLYVSIGEGGINFAARFEHVLTGKILRITKDGNIPADNPFQGPGTARCNVTGHTTEGSKCQETFAWGLRNPFRIAFDPNAAGTRFFVNDVGNGHWEEIDLGQAGADYGWNLCEGTHNAVSDDPCTNAPPGHVGPLFEYRHNQVIPGTTSPANCNSITGGAFVPNGVWPGHDGVYLFGDWVCGEIFKLTESGGVWSASDFAQGVGVVTAMIFGPHDGGQALYYAKSDFSGGGEVRRIARTPAVGPLDYFTIAPCRLVDTRVAGPALAAGSTRGFMATGSCGIPPAAKVIATNVTVVSPSSTGHLQIWPGGTPATSTSVINFGAGQTRSNNMVILLGSGGGFDVLGAFPGGSAHLIVDVVGWFE